MEVSGGGEGTAGKNRVAGRTYLVGIAGVGTKVGDLQEAGACGEVYFLAPVAVHKTSREFSCVRIGGPLYNIHGRKVRLAGGHGGIVEQLGIAVIPLGVGHFREELLHLGIGGKDHVSVVDFGKQACGGLAGERHVLVNLVHRTEGAAGNRDGGAHVGDSGLGISPETEFETAGELAGKGDDVVPRSCLESARAGSGETYRAGAVGNALDLGHASFESYFDRAGEGFAVIALQGDALDVGPGNLETNASGNVIERENDAVGAGEGNLGTLEEAARHSHLVVRQGGGNRAAVRCGVAPVRVQAPQRLGQVAAGRNVIESSGEIDYRVKGRYILLLMVVPDRYYGGELGSVSVVEYLDIVSVFPAHLGSSVHKAGFGDVRALLAGGDYQFLRGYVKLYGPLVASCGCNGHKRKQNNTCLHSRSVYK